MSLLRFAPVLLAGLAVASCGSPPKKMTLQIESVPAGADVYVSRKGKKVVQAKIGFIKGSMDRKEYTEEFTQIGTTPMEYVTPLEEEVTDATLLGVGGRGLVRYGEALVRIEKEGFEPAVRHVRLEKGKATVQASLIRKDP